MLILEPMHQDCNTHVICFYRENYLPIAKTDLDHRVEAVRTKLGLNTSDADVRIEELNAKIDALTAAVAKLAAK
jgi:trans-2-enoyl-CoA reductase